MISPMSPPPRLGEGAHPADLSRARRAGIEKVNALREFLATLQIRSPRPGAAPGSVHRILAQVKAAIASSW